MNDLQIFNKSLRKQKGYKPQVFKIEWWIGLAKDVKFLCLVDVQKSPSCWLKAMTLSHGSLNPLETTMRSLFQDIKANAINQIFCFLFCWLFQGFDPPNPILSLRSKKLNKFSVADFDRIAR